MGFDPAGSKAEAALGRLRAERDRLAHTLQQLQREHEEDGPIDMLSGDSGASTTEAATNLGLSADVQRQIDEVDAALARIDNGTYGIDEETGEPIDPERLEAFPAARTNIRP